MVREKQPVRESGEEEESNSPPSLKRGGEKWG